MGAESAQYATVRRLPTTANRLTHAVLGVRARAAILATPLSPHHFAVNALWLIVGYGWAAKVETRR